MTLESFATGMNSKLETIAQEKLRIETLKTRNMDSLDFHNVAVWEVKNALMTAYLAGYSSARESF